MKTFTCSRCDKEKKEIECICQDCLNAILKHAKAYRKTELKKAIEEIFKRF